MITLWPGNANPALVTLLVKALACSLCPAQVGQFPNGESRIEIPARVSSDNTMVLIQSLSPPTNHHLIELLLMADAAHQAGYKHIVACIPFFAYARQDKPQSFFIKTIADLMNHSAIQKIISLDVHSAMLQNCLSIPFQELELTALFANDIQKKYAHFKNSLMVIAPDTGSILRAERLSKALRIPYRVINKKNPPLFGDLEGYHCIIVDDIVDSGKTLRQTIQQLKRLGALSIIAYVTHGLFSGDALEKLLSSEIQEIVITDSIATSAAVSNCNKIRVLSIIPLLINRPLY